MILTPGLTRTHLKKCRPVIRSYRVFWFLDHRPHQSCHCPWFPISIWPWRQKGQKRPPSHRTEPWKTLRPRKREENKGLFWPEPITKQYIPRPSWSLRPLPPHLSPGSWPTSSVLLGLQLPFLLMAPPGPPTWVHSVFGSYLDRDLGCVSCSTALGYPAWLQGPSLPLRAVPCHFL